MEWLKAGRGRGGKVVPYAGSPALLKSGPGRGTSERRLSPGTSRAWHPQSPGQGLPFQGAPEQAPCPFGSSGSGRVACAVAERPCAASVPPSHRARSCKVLPPPACVFASRLRSPLRAGRTPGLCRGACPARGEVLRGDAARRSPAAG